MLRSLVACLFLLSTVTTEAFAPPRFVAAQSIRPTSSSSILLRMHETKADDSFDGIEDDGDLISDDDGGFEDGGDAPSEEGIDKLLNRALADSVKSVQSNLPPELQDDDASMNIMDDPSFKEEIAEIFDKATVDLKGALDDIRKEQDEFAAASAAKNAADTQAATAQDQARLATADKNMVKMLERVNKETAEVQRAVDELEEAQKGLSADPVMQMAGGGLIKQAALAGAILFTARGGIDAVSMIGGDGSHAVPALVQGALALGCAGYFFFA